MLTKPRRRYKNAASRRLMYPAPQGANRLARRTPIIPTLGTVAGSVLPIEFDQRVSLTGTPQYVAQVAAADALPVSAAQVDAQTIELTYAGAPSDPIVIPFEDPAVRNLVGGYVQPGTYDFPD